MRYLRLGQAGLRGMIGSGLSPSMIMDFASAMATDTGGGRILLARDSRTSSPMIHAACSAALRGCGATVIDAGVCPAPLAHYAIPRLDLDGGLLIGAGHHPAGWNAVVPVAANGAYFNEVRIQNLLDIFHSRRYAVKRWDSIGGEEPAPVGLTDEYLDKLVGTIDAAAVKDAKLTVVADFCNGPGLKLADGFARRMGVRLVAINDIVSGVLPHDPEPRPRSSFQARSIVKALEADIGFVFNSDMSRTAVVTDRLETLSEEYTFPLVAERVLAENQGGKVVTNHCTTRTLDEVVAKHGGTVVKTKVGQAAIIDGMLDCGAVLAGDGSGSVAMNSPSLGFDGFLTMALILETMALNKTTSGALADNLPRYHLVKRTIACPSARAYSSLRRIGDAFPDAVMSDDDGFRFDWPDGWIHLRASMTEPIVRMIVEWKNKQEAEDVALRVRGILERLVA